MEKIWVKRLKDFEEKNESDLAYYLAMSPEERLDIVQFLRETHLKLLGDWGRASREGLRRSVKVIKQV